MARHAADEAPAGPRAPRSGGGLPFDSARCARTAQSCYRKSGGNVLPLAGRRHPRRAARLTTACGSNCASGDNERSRLCIRRQPASHTVHPATAIPPNCVSDDNERTETGSGCRRMHSLSRDVSPDAQFIDLRVARCTVWAAGRACSAWLSRDPSHGAWREVASSPRVPFRPPRAIRRAGDPSTPRSSSAPLGMTLCRRLLPQPRATIHRARDPSTPLAALGMTLCRRLLPHPYAAIRRARDTSTPLAALAQLRMTWSRVPLSWSRGGVGRSGRGPD